MYIYIHMYISSAVVFFPSHPSRLCRRHLHLKTAIQNHKWHQEILLQCPNLSILLHLITIILSITKSVHWQLIWKLNTFQLSPVVAPLVSSGIQPFRINSNSSLWTQTTSHLNEEFLLHAPRHQRPIGDSSDHASLLHPWSFCTVWCEQSQKRQKHRLSLSYQKNTNSMLTENFYQGECWASNIEFQQLLNFLKNLHWFWNILHLIRQGGHPAAPENYVHSKFPTNSQNDSKFGYSSFYKWEVTMQNMCDGFVPFQAAKITGHMSTSRYLQSLDSSMPSWHTSQQQRKPNFSWGNYQRKHRKRRRYEKIRSTCEVTPSQV